jgi:hypothetical protein
MTIFICQVPEYNSPHAWMARNERDALSKMGWSHECLTTAVEHDMSAGYWARTQEELYDMVCGDMHADREARDAVVALITLRPNKKIVLENAAPTSRVRTVLSQIGSGDVMQKGVVEVYSEPHQIGQRLGVVYLPQVGIGGCFVAVRVHRLHALSLTEAVLVARLTV